MATNGTIEDDVVAGAGVDGNTPSIHFLIEKGQPAVNLALHRESPRLLRHFTFAKANLVGAKICISAPRRLLTRLDDDALLKCSKTSKAGEIRIDCCFCEVEEGGGSAPSQLEFREHTRIHERKKKGISHCVT